MNGDRAPGSGLTRRGFGALALGGLAASAVRAELPAPPPDSRDRLIARARVALDAHRDSFALRDRIAVADFSRPSFEPRLHIVDLISGRIDSYLCAHGKGSDPDHTGFLQLFSNQPGSAATSQGAYITGAIYDGIHGSSMRLIGLDSDNSNAEPRAIVIHSAWYVSPDQIRTYGKIGRSDGCFVVENVRLHEVVGLIGPGRMLYAGKV